MFSRRLVQPRKALSLWTNEDVQEWLENHGFNDLISIFREKNVDGKYLCSSSGEFLEEAEAPDKERLLTAVYELKSLSNQPVPSSPWSSPITHSDGEENSPVRLVGYSTVHTPNSGSKVNGWKRSHSLVPESRKSGVGTALLRSPAQSGMASATRSARLSLAFEGNLQSNISSTLLTKQGMVKVYGGVLRPEIEYKTVAVSLHTTAKELVSLVLEKYDCPTRDRNLYYVVMITGKSPNAINQSVQLRGSDCPLILQTSCIEPIVRFELRALEGSLVKVYGEDVSPGASYKSVRISDKTTAKELTDLMLKLYNCTDKSDVICLEEISQTHGTGRVLCDHELPLTLMKSWKTADAVDFHLKRRVSPQNSLVEQTVPFKSDSVTSFGDSGVERDIHITPPLTPPNSICNSRATEKQKYRLSVISDSGVDMMKQYSDERMPPVTESQSFLSLSGLSVASVDTVTTHQYLFDDHSDLDHQLELLRQRSLTSGTDLVPKGHLEETENGPVAVVSLSDLSRSQLTPQDVVPTSQRESNNSESSGGTVQSDEQTPEASPTAVQRRVSRTVSSQLTLYDLLTTSRLVSLDCHIQADHLGIHLMNGRPEHLRGDELQVGACVREVDHDSPFNKLEQGDYIVEVNGKSVLNLSAERVMSLLEGLDSLDLLLVVARAGGSSHYDTALIENLRSRNAEMERTLQGKKQEAQNATRLMQESLIAINDLKLEKENIYKKVEQLKLTIKSLENDKQSLKLQQASLREEVADAHSRAEQAYSALRDMSQKMEQLQQHQIKRINEAEEQRHVDEAALQEQVSRIKALEAELHSLRSATPNSDPHLQQKCRDLQVQVVQLEGHCLQLDEELKVAKTSRALLLKQLKKQEQRVEEVEQEQDKKDRFLQQWQMGTQVQSSDSELSQSLAEAQQDVQEKEDLIRGLNAALVELQRARTSEVMRLEADLVRLRKHIASREANADGLDSRGSEELLSAIRKQEKVIDRLSSQLKEAQYQQRAADERANQLSAALKNKMRERDRQASLGDHEKMERREAELARAELQSQLTGLLAIVRERAPEILDTLTSSDQV